jgi:putative FmdB family regulatory protein
MPLFDFKCVKCGHITEELAKRDTTSIQCPKCGDVMDKLFPDKVFTKIDMTNVRPYGTLYKPPHINEEQVIAAADDVVD